MNLFSSFIFPSNSFLSWIDKSALGFAGVSVDQNFHTFSSFLLAVYCTKQFCRHQSPFQKSGVLLYTSMVNLVSIQQFLRSTKASLFFLYQFLFISHMFFSFCLEVPESFGSPPKFHHFQSTCCILFLLLTSMCTCEKSTSARRVISHGAFIWGERRDSAPPPRWYIGYPIYRLDETIYRLGDISSVSYKQLGDTLLERAKTQYIVLFW